MPKICDHTTVGMFIWNEDRLLLIERGKRPYGYAVPAGHVDGDATFEIAAKRELKEEVGLDTESIELLVEGRKENKCRREGGTWHYWKLYKIIPSGNISRSLDETKRAGWYDRTQIQELARRTEEYKFGKVSEEDWEKSPGLELVMCEWFKELKVF
ncbi:MAG: NUDIX domain-containing protein [Patescibacteria group bacterium]